MMKRLTTDNPTDNIEASLNLFYVRDGDAFIRGGGDAPDYADISVTDFIRKTARTLCPDMLLPESAEEISFAMAEYLFDGYEEPSGLIALLYTAAWSYAELRERLKAYEDTGLTPEEIKAPFTEDAMINLAAQALGVEPSRLRELAEADKDGRVIILPCKVYETDGVRVYEHTVREVIYETAGGPAFDKNAIGKSIFLTREEAERASRETQGKEDADGATDKPE